MKHWLFTALYGLRVLCIDIDQQANLTKGLGMDKQAKMPCH
ncbi:ParA family protein [Piscirickettsia salmonis]|nr:AAA family ATPase [Piscirickettsia salmonis]